MGVSSRKQAGEVTGMLILLGDKSLKLSQGMCTGTGADTSD